MPRDQARRLAVEDRAPIPEREGLDAARLAALNAAHAGASAQSLLAAMIRREFAGRIALVSSFGADSATLLHLVAEIDPTTPVLFLETRMLFPETLAYQRELARRLGLADVRLIRPDPADIARLDPKGELHQGDVDGCCHIRKVAPLERALSGFDAWITGRKRHQSDTRATMALIERDDAGRGKINPLADWSAEDVRAHMRAHDLPAHPMVARGYPSLGCAPCTTAVAEGEDPRAGRWRDAAKVECGIHLENGKLYRVRRARQAPMDRNGPAPDGAPAPIPPFIADGI